MKKYFAFVLAISVVLLSGCFNPVFESIEKEVPLAKGKVSGTVNSIVRFDDASGSNLVCSNGSYVFYKKCGDVRNEESTSSVWKNPGNEGFESLSYSYELGKYIGQYIIKTAADDKYVYILTAEIQDNGDGETEPSAYHLYYADACPAGEDAAWKWNVIENSEEILNNSGTAITVFSTNDVEISKRAAFLRGNNNSLYKLDTKLSSSIEASSITMGDGSVYEATETAKTVKSAISTDSGILFFTTMASVKGNNCYFYAADDDSSSKVYENTDIFMKKDGKEAVKVYAPRSSSKKNDGKPIMSIAVTDDYLIFGCGNPGDSVIGDGGIYHINLGKINSKNFSEPLNETDSFTTNADAALTQYYEIRSLLVENPSDLELNACIYASITFKSAGNSISVSYENKGLWAYYPGRGNWNRE